MSEHKDPRLNDRGHEVLDQTPMAKSLGFREQKSLAQQMREMVTSELARRSAIAAGYETFEEADDFCVGDDYDPHSPHELDEEVDQLPPWREEEIRKEIKKEAKAKFRAEHPTAPPPKPDLPASAAGSSAPPAAK